MAGPHLRPFSSVVVLARRPWRRRRIGFRLRLALAVGLMLCGSQGRAIAQGATLIPAFKGGVRPNAVLQDPQSIIPISSACYAAASGKARSPDVAQSCIIEKLKAIGASAQAIAFAAYAPVPAAIEYYKQSRNVAAVYAVMRWADGASGWALIGDSGEAVGMWEPTGVERDPRFAAFMQAHPGATLWMPVDRGDTPVALPISDGGERLIMPFTIKTCHACAVIGKARLGFDFDRAGRYRGDHLLNIATLATNTQ